MERVGQERADCKRGEQTAALDKAGTMRKQNEPAKRERERGRRGQRNKERETRRNCDAPGAFGISIMSKALAGGLGGRRRLSASTRLPSGERRNSSVKYRPEGHVFNSEYIIRDYLPLANGLSA